MNPWLNAAVLVFGYAAFFFWGWMRGRRRAIEDCKEIVLRGHRATVRESQEVADAAVAEIIRNLTEYRRLEEERDQRERGF